MNTLNPRGRSDTNTIISNSAYLPSKIKRIFWKRTTICTVKSSKSDLLKPKNRIPFQLAIYAIKKKTKDLKPQKEKKNVEKVSRMDRKSSDLSMWLNKSINSIDFQKSLIKQKKKWNSRAKLTFFSRCFLLIKKREKQKNPEKSLQKRKGTFIPASSI